MVEIDETKFSGDWNDLKNLPDLPEGLSMSEYQSSENEKFDRIDRLQFDLNLTRLGYPNGILMNLLDNSNIASTSSNVSTTYGTDPSVTLNEEQGSSDTAPNGAYGDSETQVTHNFQPTEKCYISRVGLETIDTTSYDGNTDVFISIYNDTDGTTVVNSYNMGYWNSTYEVHSVPYSEYSEVLEPGKSYSVQISTNGDDYMVWEKVSRSTAHGDFDGVGGTSETSGGTGWETTRILFNDGHILRNSKDLGYQPTTVTATAEYVKNGQDIKLELLDGSGSTITVLDESQFGEAVSISTSSTVVQLKPLLVTDGASSPTFKGAEVGLDG